MTTGRHNEFLDPGDSNSEDGSQGYNSEAEDLRKGARSTKRRKLDRDTSDGSDGEEPSQEPDNDAVNEKEVADEHDAQYLGSKSKSESQKKPANTELPGISKPLTKKNLVATEASIKRSGVVYLSRIPPFMKPAKLRSLLEPYGAINRIFLTPEEAASHARRVRNGGNKKRSFTDGWVEFTNKANAKKACELLNARTIGGKKGTYYHDDIWNLLYLKGFKWHNLTEQIAAENAEWSSRMRAEISKSTKENKAFVQNVERAKMLEGMESKKAAKRVKEAREKADSDDNKPPPLLKKGGERQRQFKQTTVAPKKNIADQPEDVKRVLSKIF